MEAPLLPGFLLDQTFFGFKPEDRVRLHENIFNLIWHGDGRWDWDDIYHMPIFLRTFWTKKLNSILESRIAERDAQIEAMKNKPRRRK
jgi:hypothetical protein